MNDKIIRVITSNDYIYKGIVLPKYRFVYNKRRVAKLFKKYFNYDVEIACLSIRKIGGYTERKYKYNVINKDGEIIYYQLFLEELGEILDDRGLYDEQVEIV